MIASILENNSHQTSSEPIGKNRLLVMVTTAYLVLIEVLVNHPARIGSEDLDLVLIKSSGNKR